MLEQWKWSKKRWWKIDDEDVAIKFGRKRFIILAAPFITREIYAISSSSSFTYLYCDVLDLSKRQ